MMMEVMIEDERCKRRVRMTYLPCGPFGAWDELEVVS
jgi:hypothetical protein